MAADCVGLVLLTSQVCLNHLQTAHVTIYLVTGVGTKKGFYIFQWLGVVWGKTIL